MTYTASEFETIVGKMLETHKAKNADYSASGAFGNFRESEKIGVEAWRGAFIRLMDKYSRCVNLIGKGGVGEVKDESLDDTLLDLANYAVIVMCLREEAQQNKHLQKKGKDAGRTGEAGQAGEGA